jgi:tetratricopeptide (TPR) repeat protein
MKLGTVSFVVCAAMAISLYAADPPLTKLYIKTVPIGARVFLDGKEIGHSDDLFVVGPGTHTIRVQLDGYATQEKDVQVPSERITRLEVEFSKVPVASTVPSAGAEDAGIAAAAYLRKTEVSEAVRKAMLTVLRQHPDENRWSGQAGNILFGIAAKSIPTSAAGQQAVPALLSLTHMLAVQELLKAKSMRDRYVESGLTDSTTLAQAVVEASGKLRVVGTVKTLKHQAAVRDGFAIGYVLADEQDLTAQLFQAAELEKVKIAYRDLMHTQARNLMKQGNYTDAILLWRHLHSRKLVSQSLYLDAAKCFHALKQNDDAVRILSEAIEAFGQRAPSEFFEQAGDIAMSIDSPSAQKLAEDAYKRASAKLMTLVSPTSQPAKDGLEIEIGK